MEHRCPECHCRRLEVQRGIYAEISLSAWPEMLMFFGIVVLFSEFTGIPRQLSGLITLLSWLPLLVNCHLFDVCTYCGNRYDDGAARSV